MQTSRYLVDRGVLVFVVPRQRLDVSARYLSSHYRQLRCWAFPHPEREDFDQVVLMGYHRTEPHTDVHAEMRVREWAAGALNEMPSGAYTEFTIPPLPDGRCALHDPDWSTPSRPRRRRGAPACGPAPRSMTRSGRGETRGPAR